MLLPKARASLCRWRSPQSSLLSYYALHCYSLMASSIQPCNTGSSLSTLPRQQCFIAQNTRLNLLNKDGHNCPSQSPFLKDICKQGNLKEAINSLSLMLTAAAQNPTSCIPTEAYSPVIDLCASKKALAPAQQIHARLILTNALSDSAFLCTKLAFLYGKCGLVSDAEKLFDQMPERTVFSWNAMIGCYVSNGNPVKALELYEEMRLLGEEVDAFTFPCILKASAVTKNARQGAEIHGYTVKTGFISNGFVMNALLSMYTKCNDIVGARHLFDRIKDREDAVLWNSIISAYSSNQQPTEALELFREMQLAGVSPNTYTYVAVLQACENESFKKFGMEIHASVLKSSNHLDTFVANALMIMYTRCGRMAQAAKIFLVMLEKDNVSWNSMLSGFIQNELYSKALDLFNEMLAAGIKPDQVSLISILSASGRQESLLTGMEAHSYALKCSLDDDLQLGNTLMDMYAKCGRLDYMERVFRKMSTKDLISWTTVMAGYALTDCYLRAMELFREAQETGLGTDTLMIGSVLLASAGLKRIIHIKEVHAHAVKRNMCDLVMANTLVDAYGECGSTKYASRLFELIENKDVVSWTSMISAYADNGFGGEALTLFQLIKGNRMIELDSIALVSLLSAVSTLSALNKGKEIHGFLLRNGFPLEGLVANALVDMYARCGAIKNSFKIFESTNPKDTILWTTLINASGINGQGEKAIELFNKMDNLEGGGRNVSPDHITFLALLYACSHSGLIEQGRQFLNTMKQKYHLEPWPEHYACVVDLLGRANRLEEAHRFIRSMPMYPDTVVWSSLLGACHVHGNKELAEIAARELLALDPDNPGNYVLISNVFASIGKWDDVEKVRLQMRNKGLRKNPACSWIEIGNRVHTFMAQDRSHPESNEIYRKLAEMNDVLVKEGGYIAETKYVYHNVGEEVKVKMLYGHSERLAIAFALLKTAQGIPVRVTKNLRICGDCHNYVKLVSKLFDREIVVRDASRFHHFCNGVCSCGDFW